MEVICGPVATMEVIAGTPLDIVGDADGADAYYRSNWSTWMNWVQSKVVRGLNAVA
jgi:hypothetical protein